MGVIFSSLTATFAAGLVSILLMGLGFSFPGVSDDPEPSLPFLSLPRELRQQILFHITMNELARSDPEIHNKATRQRSVKVKIKEDIFTILENDLTGHLRALKLQLWIHEVSKGNQTVQGDFENAYSSWILRVGGANEGDDTNGRKAFMRWVSETAGRTTILDFGAEYE